jgi:N-methylhydantoinase B/oxoprolinase/acetone carboxylase alpha subunit
VKSSLETVWRRAISVADEISLTLLRASFSPDIRENFDYGCAIYDTAGRMLAHGWPSATGHIATMGSVVKDILRHEAAQSLAPGDVLVSNDPWTGSGHTADIFIVTPIFNGTELVGHAMNIVHHLDIGGRPNSTESQTVYEEGLRIPLMKLRRGGALNEDLIDIIRHNVRFSDKVIGDVKAQLAANDAGARRFVGVLARFGLPNLDQVSEELFARTERGMRAAIDEIPDGLYRGAMDIDDTDRQGTPLRICVAVEVNGDAVTVDFTGTSPQVDRAINSPLNFTASYAVVALKFVTDSDAPFNDGAYRPVAFRAPPGTIVSAEFPAPTYWRGGIGHLVADLIIRVMAEALPGRLPASAGSLPVWLFTVQGNRSDDRRFLLHSHAFGGMGARPTADGLASTGFPYNIQDVPTETLENETPIWCVRRELREDSGGAGRYRGGLGERLTLRAAPGRISSRSPIEVTGMFGRTRTGAPGVLGGLPGATGAILVDGVVGDDRSSQDIRIDPEQEITFLLPGGGGYGSPEDRSVGAIRADLQAGYVTVDYVRAFHAAALEEPSST